MAMSNISNSSDARGLQVGVAFQVTFVCLSAVNFVQSCYSLYLFTTHGRVEMQKVIRRLLIYLTFFEAAFNILVLQEISLDMAAARHNLEVPLKVTMPHCSTKASLIAVVFGSFLRAALTMRNWTVVIISISRADAVLRPFSIRQRKYLQRKFMAVIFSVLSSVVLVLSVISQLDYVCSSETLEVTSYAVFFYTLQSTVPFGLVLSTALIILVVLHRQSKIKDQQQLQFFQKKAFLNRKRKEHQAVRIVLLLSFTFAILELPTSVFAYIKYKTVLAVYITNLFVVFDSTMNFVIYVFTTKVFKNSFILLCHKSSTCENSYQKSAGQSGCEFRMTTKLCYPETANLQVKKDSRSDDSDQYS